MTGRLSGAGEAGCSGPCASRRGRRCCAQSPRSHRAAASRRQRWRDDPAMNSSWDFGLGSTANNRKSRITVALTYNRLIFSHVFSQSELTHVTSNQIKKTEHYPETLSCLFPDTSPTQGSHYSLDL